jgi:uncharacterized cupredoxin-like copper-binding protein
VSKKSKRKRGGQKPQGQEQPVSAETQELSEEERAERRAQQKAEWAAKKKKEEREPVNVAALAWIGGIIGAVAVVGVVGFLLLSGGSNSSGSTEPTATEDPRVAGLPIAQTINLEAGGAESGSFFRPNQITGSAGEVIEIKITNTGTVSHNLRVSGEDGEYGDDRNPGDDFLSDPYAIKPGETARALVKIDKAGTYPFQCDFHPLDQKGTLVLN